MAVIARDLRDFSFILNLKSKQKSSNNLPKKIHHSKIKGK